MSEFDDMDEEDRKALFNELMVLKLGVEVAMLRHCVISLLQNTNPIPADKNASDYLRAQVEDGLERILCGGADMMPDHASKLKRLNDSLNKGNWRDSSSQEES